MELILGDIENVETINSEEVATRHGWNHLNDLVPVLTGMEALELITKEVVVQTAWHLTAAGLEVVQNGSPEFRLLTNIQNSPEGIDKPVAEKQFGDVAVREALKYKWIAFDKATNKLTLKIKDQVTDPLVSKLSALSQLQPTDQKLFKRRDLVEERKTKTFIVKKRS